MEASLELVVPGVGQIVQLDNPGQVAQALDALRDLRRQLREAEGELTHALVYASRLQGSKTLHFEGGKATVKGGVDTEYDAEAIEQGLRDLGMPEERIREVVRETVTYSVSAVEAKRAAGANPDYAAVIDAHTRKVEKRPYITVTLGGEHG